MAALSALPFSPPLSLCLPVSRFLSRVAAGREGEVTRLPSCSLSKYVLLSSWSKVRTSPLAWLKYPPSLFSDRFIVSPFRMLKLRLTFPLVLVRHFSRIPRHPSPPRRSPAGQPLIDPLRPVLRKLTLLSEVTTGLLDCLLQPLA